MIMFRLCLIRSPLPLEQALPVKNIYNYRHPVNIQLLVIFSWWRRCSVPSVLVWIVEAATTQPSGEAASASAAAGEVNSTMASSRVPTPPPPEMSCPVAENWCYTQVSWTPAPRTMASSHLATPPLPESSYLDQWSAKFCILIRIQGLFGQHLEWIQRIGFMQNPEGDRFRSMLNRDFCPNIWSWTQCRNLPITNSQQDLSKCTRLCPLPCPELKCPITRALFSVSWITIPLHPPPNSSQRIFISTLHATSWQLDSLFTMNLLKVSGSPFGKKC